MTYARLEGGPLDGDISRVKVTPKNWEHPIVDARGAGVLWYRAHAYSVYRDEVSYRFVGILRRRR